MSNVIERIPTETIQERNVGRTCDTCGCGYHGEEHAHEAPCHNPSCDGTQFPVDETYERRVPGYVVVRCDCGTEVTCGHHFWNQCNNCGADYDGQGNRLAPREFWGEETGESLADMMTDFDPDSVF